jgi:hypothetical protein
LSKGSRRRNKTIGQILLTTMKKLKGSIHHHGSYWVIAMREIASVFTNTPVGCIGSAISYLLWWAQGF